ncbi:hypothetical protein QBC36DRAFT_354511 [Triangularia setosa]|uniref:Uncharacterized protein n=1 Tax=Triangularia setosa TaxID=2587417 RepID=A0AAN6WF43_9PEZI|nr:hypothetical protein QBC36DRAFT_354511 [Podospora setosa]
MNEATLKSLSVKMKRRARLDHAARCPFPGKCESATYYSLFIRAMNNVLSTELAQFTYAKIIDGLPIEDVTWDRRVPAVYDNHPIEHHPDLYPRALDCACKHKEEIYFFIPSFNPGLINAYTQSTPGTKAFNTPHRACRYGVE